VTEPYIAQGICGVLRYEGGEGGQNSQNPRYVICERSHCQAIFIQKSSSNLAIFV
jgi:hypothetical protein